METTNTEEKKWALIRAINAVEADIRSLEARRDNAKRAQQQAIALGDKPFWFRVSMDFRGRLYYKGAHMNPQMGDDVKVILTLANKKRLGVSGLSWLLWGVASSAGFDKSDFESRVQWSVERLFEIRQAVNDPEKSEMFVNEIMTGGEPALFLQRATELIQAIDSGDVENYETNITIAMDATCSGLQILSAVAKDAHGGQLVNITATHENQTEKADVYGTVAKLLTQQYAAMPSNFFARWICEHGLHRRFTKRAVMTLPYSATVRSATSYVKDELQGNAEKGLLPYPLPSSDEERIQLAQSVYVLLGKQMEDNKAIDDGHLYFIMASVIARDIHETCRHTIPAAMNLLTFFKATPRHLADHAVWYTPDGFRVKQRYGSTEQYKVGYNIPVPEYVDKDGVIQTTRLIQRTYSYLDPSHQDRSKASNGMPPNWVHSLDGCLVRRVMLHSDFDVVAIHDSFAAHPADCENLYKTLREEFVWLVEQDPLDMLCKGLNKQIGQEVFTADNLTVNTWDPKSALESKFLFC